MPGKTFEVTVVSRERPLWKGEASQAEVPAMGGGLTFLPGHASAFILLSEGEVKLKGEEERDFSVQGGFASFEQNQMVIAVDSAKEEGPGEKS